MKKESLDALGAVPVEVSLTTEPVILHEGRYRLYEKPDGTLRVQYRRTDRDEDDFMEIPGAVLRMAKAVSEGNLNPLQALKMMRNGTNV